MSTRRRRSFCDDLLPARSIAPPKPPRGFLRSEPVKIEPIRRVDNDENKPQMRVSPVSSSCQFSTIKKYQSMKNYFRAAVQERENCAFSGSDAVNIIEDYLQTNREQFSASTITKGNALKVLEMWLRENVIRPVNFSAKDSPPLFHNSKRVMYTMNPDEDHKYGFISSSYIYFSKYLTGTVDLERPLCFIFNNLFWKEFNWLLVNMQMMMQLYVIPLLVEPHSIVVNILLLHDNFLSIHVFSMSHLIFLVARNGPLMCIKDLEEAELYDAALCRLLTIVEIPMLDNLTCAPGQSTKSASILSTILSKIGFGGSTSEMTASKDEEMDDLLNSAAYIRPLLPWFQLARICAPTLYFKASGKPSKLETYNWAKMALQAVSERYSSITHRGSSPLIPLEFSPILDAIVKQLLGRKQNKTELALQYLSLMIPLQLRNHLGNVLQFLERTMGTDVFVSLQNPYYLGKKGDNENFEIVLNELRSFILPQSIQISDQNQLIESLIELRKKGRFGTQPVELREDLKAVRASVDKKTMPVRFCESAPLIKDFDAEAEVARTLTAIIDDVQISLAEKQKKCELFKQHHPRIYQKYFSHLTW
ncbi:hypothetical protein DICVIV_04078 [Dictyocaulus viviparus]|uniref:DEP domain-containing protein n=1 Tax=Dictyocaulus viviparus TaxID=29172 RepID=A0A0D8XYN2_DICVI|nr:hypothetical protein DICVIV_04078 [Dictyocaulus viviparus]